MYDINVITSSEGYPFNTHNGCTIKYLGTKWVVIICPNGVEYRYNLEYVIRIELRKAL